ncbi:MAG: cache domain-containing protein, partial [Loktanella sp.]|nr:cache domain-containing protein [Loktanella sp.]
MRIAHSVSLSLKLPVIIAGLCLIAALAVAILGYVDSRKALIAQTLDGFDILIDERSDALERWFSATQANVLTLAANPTVGNAMQALASAFHLMTDADGLQAAYITNNPHPFGERHLLDKATEPLPYHFQHGAYHPFFRESFETTEFHDIFLLSASGDVIYSVAKKSDFATNFVSGPYRESGLAEVFRAARDGIPGQVYFADFAPYAPSGDMLAFFVATQIVNAEGGLTGIFAVQITPDQIDTILNKPAGLGETGVIYLVGADGITRYTSRFSDDGPVLRDLGQFAHVMADLNNGFVSFTDVIGINGARSIAEVNQIDGFGKPWRVVAEKQMTEVLRPVVAMRNHMLLVSGLAVIVATVLGV